MTRARIPALITILVLALIPLRSPVASGRVLQGPELPPELRKGVTDLESRYAVMSGSGHFRVQVYDDDNQTQTTSDRDFEFALKPGMMRYVESDISITGRNGAERRFDSVVTCYDPKTKFRLHRMPGSRVYVVDKREPTTPRSIAQAELELGAFHLCPFAITRDRLTRIIQDESYTLMNNTRVDADGASMVKLEFGPSTALKALVEPGKRGRMFFDYTVLVAPDAGWAVRRFSAFNHSLADGQLFSVTTGTVDYKQVVSGPPVPSLLTVRRYFSELEGKMVRLDDGGEFVGSLRSVETWRFDKVRFEPEPDRSFTLPAFGVAEADTPKSHEP